MFWSKKEKFTDRAIAYLKSANLNDGKPAISLPHAATPVVKSYSADLCICYVIDSGNQFEYIQNCHVEKDGIDDDKLHRIGLENLRKWAGLHNTRVQPYGNIFAVLMGGNFEASLILLEDFWDHSFRQFLKGEYAAAIPARDILSFCDTNSPEFQKALELARSADVVIYIGGISAELEGEEGGKFKKLKLAGFSGGDRSEIELPAPQITLLQELQKTGKPVVFVNCSGSAVAFPWAAEHLPAILQVWYPGQAGGTALADILFGDCNPSGRLPVTFYRSTGDLPAFENYAMSDRTYRYFTGQPLYPFGHGLSYTRFEYGKLTVGSNQAKADGKFTVSFQLKNIGARTGDEVVQIYVRHLNSKVSQPVHSLAAFQRIHVAAGSSAAVNLEFPASALRQWDVAAKRYVVEPGEFEIEVGESAGDIRAQVRAEIVE